MKKIIKVLSLTFFLILSIIFCVLYYDFFRRSRTLNEENIFPNAISLTIENKTPEEVYIVVNHFYTPNEISLNDKNNYIETYYYSNDTIEIRETGKYSDNVNLVLSSFIGDVKILPNDFRLIFLDRNKKEIYTFDKNNFFLKFNFNTSEWKIIIKKYDDKFMLE